MSMNLPKPPKMPCGSCPYRRDVPSGVWDQVEYDKLPLYDGDTGSQSWALFMCHQQDGCLCGGWLATHGTDELLALRVNQVHLSTFKYKTKVPVFASGAEARAHGMRDIEAVGEKAERVIKKLERKAALRDA